MRCSGDDCASISDHFHNRPDHILDSRHASSSEGNHVAKWLNVRGVAAFVLRYRLVPSGEDGVQEMMSKSPEESHNAMSQIAPLAGADGLRALALVR